MTLLGDISQVHDGVLKAPPLRAYGGAFTRSKSLYLAEYLRDDNKDHESAYKLAKDLAVESVRCMQLASKNIDKERQEVENRKAPTARTLYDIVNHDERESCTTCADSKRCNPYKNVTWCINWNEREQKYEPDYVFEVGLVLGTVRQK